MTKRKGFIVGVVTAASAGILIGSLAARRRGNRTEVSMGLARQPEPKKLGRTTGERLMNAAEMPTCSGWKE